MRAVPPAPADAGFAWRMSSLLALRPSPFGPRPTPHGRALCIIRPRLARVNVGARRLRGHELSRGRTALLGADRRRTLARRARRARGASPPVRQLPPDAADLPGLRGRGARRAAHAGRGGHPAPPPAARASEAR